MIEALNSTTAIAKVGLSIAELDSLLAPRGERKGTLKLNLIDNEYVTRDGESITRKDIHVISKDRSYVLDTRKSFGRNPAETSENGYTSTPEEQDAFIATIYKKMGEINAKGERWEDYVVMRNSPNNKAVIAHLEYLNVNTTHKAIEDALCS